MKCFIGLVMARNAAIVLLELWSMGQNQNQKCQYETEYEAIKEKGIDIILGIRHSACRNISILNKKNIHPWMLR